jgi:hypothetical protein
MRASIKQQRLSVLGNLLGGLAVADHCTWAPAIQNSFYAVEAKITFCG